MINKRKFTLDFFLLRVETIDGSAVAGEDFVQIDEILTFEANEIEKQVSLFFFKKV